ncbi:hypothetical protein ACFC09_15640 [Streptomyces sp. NPDC056161]|uniref:hypothetical protein n=1 Tax=Streptomyces sp. NPDC056161 TaxID=3345732 RepID=UPI0035D65359
MINPDGGLYVPTAGGSVLTGCGLTGDGSASAPVEVATGSWPYSCDVETYGSVITCDSSGVLRGEPRGTAQFTTYSEQREFNDPVVPGDFQTVDNYAVTVTNPNPCIPALVIASEEVDVFLVLPSGAGAATGFNGDETYYTRNTGTGTIVGAHSQATKVVPRGVLAPGASTSVGFGAAVGRGTGGAYYYRINYILRVLLLSM